MRKRFGLTMLASAVAVAVLLGGWAIGAAHEDEHDLPKHAPEKRPAPVVGIHELMELFNEPLYELLKEEMQRKPSDNKGWNTIRDRGLQAAEVINLVAIRKVGREHQQDWPELNRTAQQAGLDLAHAAAAKDWPKTQAAYQALIKNCNDCHEKVAPDHAPILEP